MDCVELFPDQVLASKYLFAVVDAVAPIVGVGKLNVFSLLKPVGGV